MLQLEGVIAEPRGNLLLQIALVLRSANLDPEVINWVSIEGGNLVKIQILLRASDGHHSTEVAKSLRAIPDVAHVVACELRRGWTIPRLPTHVPFEGNNKLSLGETPETQGPH